MKSYDLEFKNEFWFERSQRAELMAKLPLRFVWGVAAEDNGNYLNPSSKGSLVLDPSFNMAAPESQQWLSRFCKNVRDQPFFQPMLGPLLPNWFIETFQSWMDRRCEVIAINFFFISSFHSFFYPFKKNDKKKRPVLLARGSR